MTTEFHVQDSHAHGSPAPISDKALSSDQPAATAPDDGVAVLLPGTRQLIAAIQNQLRAGVAFDNPSFMALANGHLAGSRMRGTFSSKYAYDVLETALNGLLLDRQAFALMEMAEPTLGLTHVLQPLLRQLPTQVNRTQEQILFQQFSTPPTLAFIAARLLNPRHDDLLLEPSAGTGSLAIWPRAVGARVLVNEISPRRAALLALLGFQASGVDAEFLDDLYPAEVVPTAVLMNPPFSATGGRVERNSTTYGARHIESALKRLALGGRLVSIAGAGLGIDRPKFRAWWQRIAAAYTIRSVVVLNGKGYAKYGTQIFLI